MHSSQNTGGNPGFSRLTLAGYRHGIIFETDVGQSGGESSLLECIICASGARFYLPKLQLNILLSHIFHVYAPKT